MNTILQSYLPYGTTLAAVLALFFGFVGAPLWLWSILAAGVLFLWNTSQAVWVGFAVLATVSNIPQIRRYVFSAAVLKFFQAFNIMPKISETERIALEAGDVWIERDLFSGRPNFKKLLKEPYPRLTAEEQAFLDGPVEELCKMLNDWEIWKSRDLPKNVWDFIKEKRFLGMIIPKKYGGLEFTALAHSEVLAKISSRSIPACVSIMVPNSLGPAELLIHYGTEEQKNRLLPKLAKGEEVPCFGLTEPHAGSDAGSIQASGVVFKGDDGKLYIRLNWNKRWITLAAISTILGIAFKLKDPDELLGKGKNVGITCALIPANTPGVVANERHDPLGVPFYNCPTQGKDVVVPVDAIIGGVAYAGKGWKMLMESLAAGRGVSLPAQSTGMAKLALRVVTAHATVRKQFGVSIGKFEGIADPLARTAGFTYMMEAARRYTCGAIDQGKKPPVVTAIAKYNFTEICRKIVIDGMDILGGSGISMGPRNLFAHAYIAAPIAITVEGANIMTRTLIIFGQGALRAHPFAYQEVKTVEAGDLAGFDRAFWGHIGHVVRNTFRAVMLSLSRGYFHPTPRLDITARYYRRLSWASASFALMADITMGTLGGKLKMREHITGRFADILSWMYFGTAILRRYEAEGRRKQDQVFVRWGMNYALAQIQAGFDGIFSNTEMPWFMNWVFRGPLRWWSRVNSLGTLPSDSLTNRVAESVMKPGGTRESLCDGLFIPKNPTDQIARLENAFKLTVESEDVFMKVRKAVKTKKLVKKPSAELYQDAITAGIITKKEFELIAIAEKARDETIQVDSFGLKEYLAGK